MQIRIRTEAAVNHEVFKCNDLPKCTSANWLDNMKIIYSSWLKETK